MQQPHRPDAFGDLLSEVMLGRQAVEASAADHRDAERAGLAGQLRHHAAGLAGQDGVNRLTDLAIEAVAVDEDVDGPQEAVDPAVAKRVPPI